MKKEEKLREIAMSLALVKYPEGKYSIQEYADVFYQQAVLVYEMLSKEKERFDQVLEAIANHKV